MIRILFVTSGATAGGAERQLLHFLRLCDKNRFECRVVTVLSADSPARRGGVDFRSELDAIGVPVRSLDCPRFPSLGGILALREAVRSAPAEIVQGYGVAVDLVLRFLVGRKRPLVGSVRGPQEQRPGWVFRLDGLTSRRLCGYISNSVSGKAALVRRGGVAPRRVTVIPNGLDTAGLAPARDARHRLRAEWGVGERDCVVLTVANLNAAKGHEDIVRAMPLMRGLDRLRFVFAGDDRSGGSLEALARELGVRERILFLGHRQDVPDLLSAADVFLLASHWEGMSNALMEAMHAGIPIVATDVGDARQLLDGGRCGELIPPKSPESIAEAVRRSIENWERAKAQAAKARERIMERYSVEAMVRACEGYYESIARPRRAAAQAAPSPLSAGVSKE